MMHMNYKFTSVSLTLTVQYAYEMNVGRSSIQTSALRLRLDFS